MTDPKFDNFDPLKKVYAEEYVNPPVQRELLAHKDTALLCIDMQYLDAAPGIGVFADAEASGVPPEAQEYYFDRLKYSVFPNVRKIQDMFRNNNLEIIHTRIQSLTKDGRDRSPGHKRLGLHAPPGSKEAEFIEQVAPLEDEIILNKTASGVFNSTNLEYILRNLEIKSLVIVGVYSNECVSTAVRDACDLGFYVTLISDAIATVTPELQKATITTMKDRYAIVVNTKEYINQMNNLYS